ncbi:peptidylprolyl isomerase [Tateyamaria sp. SN6-1]|uniref:peptidylprolyl isomerase n=1 Tax=Tateyamaria sp. SN6-1 TaxID=3092148 RepID=UPI0039F465C1
MSKRFFSLSALAVSAAMALPAAAQDADTVLATVNGTEITLGHVIVARQSLPEQYQQLPNEVLFDGILGQLVEQELLAQSSAADKAPYIQLSLDNEERSLTAGDAINSLLEAELTEDALRAAYETQKAESAPQEEYNASHILVETEEAAQAVIEEIEGGADFAAVAREKSTGPSGPNGGSLGWFGTGAMVPSFEAAVIALEVGAVSAPVQTQFGWHVIILNDTRTQSFPTFEEARDELADNLRADVVANHIASLREAAEVDQIDLEGFDLSLMQDVTLVE